MENEQLMAHLQKLSVGIGPRYGGSSGNHLAADYIGQIFTEAGLEVERQKFACPHWTDNGTRLQLMEQVLPAVSNAFSPPCDVKTTAVLLTLAQMLNQNTFYSRGVPSIALSATGHIHNIHLRSDTIDFISNTKLHEVVAIVKDIVASLTNRSAAWTREKENN